VRTKEEINGQSFSTALQSWANCDIVALFLSGWHKFDGTTEKGFPAKKRKGWAQSLLHAYPTGRQGLVGFVKQPDKPGLLFYGFAPVVE
jgi:hypothetical protein